MTTASPSAWQALLSVIETDLLSTAGAPLLTFLNSFAAAAGDPLKLAAAWVQLQGQFVGALPTLEATLSQQIANTLTAKLSAAISTAQSASLSAKAV